MHGSYQNNTLLIDDQLEFYRDLVHSINGSIHIIKLDDKGNTMPIWTNGQYEKVMEYSLEYRQKIGFSYKDDELYHPDDIEIIRNGAKKLLANREEGHASMFRVRVNDDWKWVLLSCRAITIDNDPGYFLCFMVDIDENMTDYQSLTEKYTQEIKSLKNELKLKNLSSIEKEIIRALASGMSTKEIANSRERSYETINNHKRNIFKKLNINKVSELVGFAVESGLK